MAKTDLSGIVFNKPPQTEQETIQFQKSQIENLQASLASITSQLLNMQETLAEKEIEISELRRKLTEKESLPAVRQDDTLTLTQALINLYKFIFLPRKAQ